MFKLLLATVVALYGVLILFGDESRRPADVARSEPLGLELVPVSAVKLNNPAQPVLVSNTTDRDAIEIAMANGREIRADRRNAKPIDRSIEVVAAAQMAERKSRYWYVTGSRVNLRGGPGTSNAVVGQVTFGTEAFVLGDRGDWYQIRLADGSLSGWIFGKFLSEKLPG